MADVEGEEVHAVTEVPKKDDGATSPNDSGEAETFEDATASPDERSPTSSPVSSVRSLTDRRSSKSKRKDASPPPPLPTRNENQKEGEIKETVVTVNAVNGVTSPASERTSNGSMANVELNEHEEALGNESHRVPELKSISSRSSVKSTLQGLSGALPSVPWSPPPAPTSIPANNHAPPPPSRKLSSPFSWLSRGNNSAKESISSPPLSSIVSPNKIDRRGSIGTLNSNPEMMLSKLDEGPEYDANTNGRPPERNSLRDRFKLLRMREEAGISALPEDEKAPSAIAGLIGRSASLSLSLASPTSLDEKDSSTPLAMHPPSPNPLVSSSLPPGTAAGVSAGPSAFADAAAVDWDLWQSVVYEGPAAVARTSPEELNRAIASGIPNAIRGVVWQVLAHSKNDELEAMYRDLVNCGTDKEKDRMSIRDSSSTGLKDKDSAISSASSVHSDHSTPATTVTNGARSPSPPEKDSDVLAKQLAAAAAGQKKPRTKEAAAALAKLEKTIRRDMGARTSYSKFAASAGLQDGLFGLCKAYALYDEEVGYAQGMNFIAMPLLFNMPEEEAFCLMVRLMNHYHLRDLFIHDMPGLHMHLYQFERLLEEFEPALYCHLRRRQVTPHLYATQWFLTLFAYRFPLQLVLRIYDLILSEGLEAVLKFGIVLMQKNAATLLGMNDMVSLTSFLKERLFDVYIDQAPSSGSILESGFFGSSGASIDKEVYRADMLIQDACAVKITPEMLKAYAVEWEEKTKAEAAQQAELENLKSSNASLLLKVRRLEERVETHDLEHAQLATELVHAKVENEELKDKNESLTGQVEELRAVVEKQPLEVEDRLKSEMERIIKRNEEVHMENSRLEEEMSEMEKTLVATKMQYAEIQAQHETLTRKWTDLKKALD